MNLFLSSLEDVCRKYPLEEKVLITPGYRAGHEVCEALARESGGWVNLCAGTVAGLAQQVAGEHLAEQGIVLLPGYLSLVAVEEVFCALEEEGDFRYFSREGDNAGIIRAIASSILELRKAGLDSEKLQVDSFVNVEKGQDMISLLSGYESYLERNNYTDVPGLLSLALQLLSRQDYTGAVYLLPSFMQLYPLERDLVEAVAGEPPVELEADPVYSPDYPGKEAGGDDSGSDAGRLPWLYDVENSPPPAGDGSLDCFHAYGMSNEIREVFRRIQAREIPLDKVTVAYTRSEYIPGFYALAKSPGTGITVEEGLPAGLTGPGKVLFKLLDWAKEGFPASVLKEMLLAGEIEFKFENGEKVGSPEAASIMRLSGVGQGRERYRKLKERADFLEEEANDAVDDRSRELYARQSRHAFLMYEVMDDFFADFPVPDSAGRVSFGSLCTGIAGILNRLAVVKEELDEDALKGITKTLVDTGEIASVTTGLEEALERVKELFGDFRVGASGPEPGCIHLTAYASLPWTHREYTFVTGLDAGAFPGSGRQDPVLLDAERKNIHSGLSLSSEKPGENLLAMAEALAGRRGSVTLSYTSYDTVENREAFPSPFLLQFYRLLMKDGSLDYTSLINYLGKPAGCCPRGGDSYLDETEWWLGKVFTGRGASNVLDAAGMCYPGIARGRKAIEFRQGTNPTEYDGMIKVDPGELDPRRSKDIVMSAGKIEYLAGCPFAYFIHHVLGVREPEELAHDPSCWLDNSGRGNLLHELFYRFMSRARENGEKPALDTHKDVMMEMAGELAKEYRQLVPPPGEAVFRREVDEIYRCCEIFLAVEELQSSGTPELFEIPFGTEVPVEIMLGGGNSFSMRGKIDRIDRVRDGVYYVWDYKTGSTYGFDDHGYLRGGRQLQHALYAMAAEQLLKDIFNESQPRVEVSGYYFPTEKGEGQAVSRWQARREEVCSLLNHLFDILAGGCFLPADHGEKCGLCEYDQVCNREQAVARARDLIKNSEDTRLEPLRRLKDFE